jgi:hypothetical protein
MFMTGEGTGLVSVENWTFQSVVSPHPNITGVNKLFTAQYGVYS